MYPEKHTPWASERNGARGGLDEGLSREMIPDMRWRWPYSLAVIGVRGGRGLWWRDPSRPRAPAGLRLRAPESLGAAPTSLWYRPRATRVGSRARSRGSGGRLPCRPGVGGTTGHPKRDRRGAGRRGRRCLSCWSFRTTRRRSCSRSWPSTPRAGRAPRRPSGLVRAERYPSAAGLFPEESSGACAPAGRVSAVLGASDGSVWFGSDGGGLVRLQSGALQRWERRDGLLSDQVTRLAEGAEGRVWVGTTKGLQVGDGVSWDGALE